MNYDNPLDPDNDYIDKADFEIRQAELRDRSDLWNSGEYTDEQIEDEKDTEAYDAGPLDRVEDGELSEVEQLLDESAWTDGPYINARYFSQYARQLAEDINGDVYNEWPQNNIDWDAAADDLIVDYTSVTWGGQEFLVR